jgi:3-dehydroquinate synthase
MNRIPIEVADTPYDVLVGAGLLDRLHEFLPAGVSRYAIVTNVTVRPLYCERVAEALQRTGAEVIVVGLPDGEAYKSWHTLNAIYDALLGHQCDRKTVLVALGGGVIGDMTGFAAATYMRGIPFLQIPTTLLAQVDSSVGGKTAINHPRGKNMIGAFYQPKHVFADIETLATLPGRELSAGLAEVVKHGLIRDREFFEWCEANGTRLLQGDQAALTHAVTRSVQIKAAVVKEDPTERGVRALLNLGHTFGHALEAELGYGTWLHGEAVGCGLVLAADLSLRLGFIEAADVERVRACVRALELPVTIPGLRAENLLDLMRVDKKVDAGKVRFVVLRGIGHAELQAVPLSLVRESLVAGGAS